MIKVSMVGEVDKADALGVAAGEEIKRIAGPKFKEYGEAVIAKQEEAAAAKAAAAKA
jgi:hypothetical protein